MYVTDQPGLALVTARFKVDGIVYVLEQFFDRRPANVIIELPAPDDVIDGAVTGAPPPVTLTSRSRRCTVVDHPSTTGARRPAPRRLVTVAPSARAFGRRAALTNCQA